MSVTNPTPTDRIKWICLTSAEEGRAEIKRLEADPKYHRPDLRSLFIAARDKELEGANRKSLLVALEAAVNRLDKAAIADKAAQLDPASEPAWEVLAPESTSISPAALVEGINGHHARAQNDAAHAKAFGASAVKSATLAGLMLVELKAATPHGQWEQLFTSGQKRVGKSNATHV